MPVTWMAKAGGHGKTPLYQFSITPSGGTPHVVRDFSPTNNFTWNPLQEGDYVVRVTVKDGFGAPSGESADVGNHAKSRLAGPVAAVNRTSNPLVALFSAPPSLGSSILVEFKPFGSALPWRTTAPQPVTPGRSTNVLVAGLRPTTTYLMRHILSDGTTSAPLKFKTGALPRGLTFPGFSVRRAPTATVDPLSDTVLHIGINPLAGTVNTVATDLTGKVVWYYDPVANKFPGYAPSLVPGGTVLMLGGKQDGVGGATNLREVDLAGNTLRETNIGAVNAELAALGRHAITDFNHDAQRLPNGDTAVLSTAPRTVDINGTPVHYNGDMVIVLDQNFQVAWTWDPFEWLDPRRLPTQGEGPGDWTHANAVSWSPADGNLLVSLRSQDWVIKINYAGGAGDGRIIWRLGQGGDFTISSPDPSPWFSHQHDARYVDNSTLMLFDNGNTRRSLDPQADSRGQELVLDERTRRATLVLNADLGEYAPALGSAQRLPGGNFDFTAGFSEQTIGVNPDGTKNYVLKMKMKGSEYRSYIFRSVYGDSGGLRDFRV